MYSPETDYTASASSHAVLGLDELLDEVREILESPLEMPTIPPRRAQKSKTGRVVRTRAKRGSFQRIREKFGLFLAKFSRASGGPTTLSEGLVPEREENAEIIETRFRKLF